MTAPGERTDAQPNCWQCRALMSWSTTDWAWQCAECGWGQLAKVISLRPRRVRPRELVRAALAAAQPTGKTTPCICDGGTYRTELAARGIDVGRPFIVNDACPVHAAQPTGETP